MQYKVSSYSVDTQAEAPLGRTQHLGEGVFVPILFLEAVGRELERLNRPNPVEQALATLARAWQAALVPAQEMLEPTDLMLEYQRAGYDAFHAGEAPSADPWPTGTPSSESWRVGWFMANNEEGRP